MTTHRREIPVVSEDTGPTTRAGLRGDCANCFGLCCVALPFTASADFAVDKDAGVACDHLTSDHRCGIHDRLCSEGFRGCAVCDCFGAGQQVSRHTFGGRSWGEDPALAREMFATFPIVRQLHELLWYLDDALTRQQTRPLHAELATAREQTERIVAGSAEELAELDMAAYREPIAALLRRTSELVRSTLPGTRPDHAGADLIGGSWDIRWG